MRIILASKSARRKELMDLFVPNYEIIVSNADETFEEGLDIYEQSKRLGYIKAKAVYDKTEGDRIVIGSDTMVINDGEIYGKPKNIDEAREMINKLKNKKHQVITSISVLICDNGKETEYVDYDVSSVYFKDIDEEDIEKWLKNGQVLDKAGAYAIQSEFGVHVDKIEGNYSTVVGLPIHKLYEQIKKYL